MDLIITCSNSKVSLLRNISTTGNLSFAAKVTLTTGTTNSAIAIGDINGEGKPDLVLNGGSSLSILRNISVIDTIRFATKVDKTTGTGPNSIKISDIDGDGKPDLITANSTSNTVSILRNNPLIPQIIVSSNFSTFSACSSNFSSTQTFTIRGKNLVSNLIINSPSGFELSINPNTTFSPSIILTPTIDSIGSTEIFVRLANNATGNPSGNITCTSNWAITQNIAVSGVVKSTSLSTHDIIICESELPFSWNGLTFDSAGSKTKYGLINSSGCDSAATLNLTVKPTSSSTTNLSICPSELPFSWNGLTFDSAGSKTKYGLINSVGCDSAATLNLTIKPTSSSITNLSICPSELPFSWNGLTFDSAGSKTKYGLINSVGCDSSATLQLNVFNNPDIGVILGQKTNLVPSISYTYTVNQQIGASYNWFVQNGIIVSGQGSNQINVQFINSGNAKILSELINNNGCKDSVSIDLIIGSVGINETLLNSSIRIFPNPTSMNFTIEIPSKYIGCDYFINDLNGSVIIKGKIEGNQEIINTEHLTSGIYFMKINANIPPIKVVKY